MLWLFDIPSLQMGVMYLVLVTSGDLIDAMSISYGVASEINIYRLADILKIL